ncbi:MAG TPA: type III-B CRISPR module-associated protein Cmr5 [Bacillota bacterium]|nr:type III-B CRISPR module-associated protein Cmr5 [Bacillota bacterium]
MPEGCTVLKDIERSRAQFAYEKVNEAKEEFAADKKDGVKKQSKYKSLARKIPMLIKTNGLGATFAFISAKKERPHQLLYEQVGQWLKGYDGQTFGKNEDLVKVLVSLSSPEYRAVTGGVLALFGWLRRFAEGLLEGDETDGD